MKKYAGVLLVAALGLAACDKPQPPDIVQPQREALEKARGVEATLQQGADQRAAAIDEAEQK
ncbi:MAG TPA: hypothetical protein VJU83_11090 [Burkholderiales bacterium]|nr:hypothetical protein [Burkholderiales bacterium]